jgi:hypothetical protein
MHRAIVTDEPSKQHHYHHRRNYGNTGNENDALASLLLLPPGKLASGKFAVWFLCLFFLRQNMLPFW